MSIQPVNHSTWFSTLTGAARGGTQLGEKTDLELNSGQSFEKLSDNVMNIEELTRRYPQR